MPDPNQNPNNDGQNKENQPKPDSPDQTKDKGTATDPKESLKGKKDEQGIPLDPEERADFYKGKFVSSTQGANKLLEENKTLKQENEKLKTSYQDDEDEDDEPIIPQPKSKLPDDTRGQAYTAEDLQKAIPGWNQLNIEQQTAILKSYGNLQKDLDSIKDTVAKIVDSHEYQNNYAKLVARPEFAKLAENKEKFKEYAYREEHLNTPLDVLAKAFLIDENLLETKPASNPNLDDNPKPDEKENKDAGNEGLESGTGGSQHPPSNKEGFTTEEAAKLRKEDPKKYNRLAQQSKLKIVDEN